MDNERAINKYLKNFERQNSFETYGIDDDEKRIGREIVDLMKKEDITYNSAYVCLQYAYNLIKYESNFLK
ncbi:hypothetical protein NE293_10320, partial [Latilactobacillus curvatus]